MSLLPSSYAVDATRYRVSARLTGRSPRREDAIENALKAKLQARAAQRRAQEMMARQAAKELEECTFKPKLDARSEALAEHAGACGADGFTRPTRPELTR